MAGRETGSAGLRRAEAYIVDQLTRDGLQPAGRDGFYQPVSLRGRGLAGGPVSPFTPRRRAGP